ncbi:MAG TPA: nuclear transport factor 2 family protein [Vitreimonas sp.]|uniref:nuclear transport factor 2 family protein n=1 Tax=Vitreimonas sp. TaxID=3069702 RepID=UPI002D571219|nr:nuclear transport factor 2 family protein [Vitreimonas sp.]HYD88358.1 nuclear transport factor 2 family protein [Vitreimonas sp.]
MSDFIAIVRAIYDAINAGDAAGIVQHLSPDIRITQTRELPWGGEYEGLAGYAAFAKTLRHHIQSRVEVERIFAAGEDVVVIGRTIGAAKDKHTPFDVAIAHVLTVRGGKVVAARYYIDTPAMLAALSA